MRIVQKAVYSLLAGSGLALFATALFTGNPIQAIPTQCNHGGRAAEVGTLRDNPGVCAQRVTTAPASTLYSCVDAAADLGCTTVHRLSATQRKACSMGGGRDAAEVTFAEGTALCVRYPLGFPATPNTPSCHSVGKLVLGCADVLTLE